MDNLNPQFAELGQSFVQLYYSNFDTLTYKTDDNAKRTLLSLYHENAMMSFEGTQVQGSEAILAKLVGLPFKSLSRSVTTVDCQPIADNGVVIMVIGQLKTDEDVPHPFNHVFVLRPHRGGYSICHELFRLSLHNF